MKKTLVLTTIALTAIGVAVRANTQLEIKKENERVQNLLKMISDVTSRPNFHL